jgi:transcriptional antiterminator RfaH
MHKKNWHILQYKTNSHFIAQKNLTRQNFETFLPLEEVTQHQFGKISNRLKPLFPGYMFINIDKKSLSWPKINSTIGVSKLLITNNKPTPMNMSFVLELMHRCDDKGKLLAPDRLKKGDKIRVFNSPFTEFITTIEQVDSKNRVWVLMDIMGRQSRTQLMADQVSNF